MTEAQGNAFSTLAGEAIFKMLKAVGQRTETYTVNGPIARLSIGHLAEPPEFLQITVGDFAFGSEVSLTIDLRPLLQTAGIPVSSDAP